MCFQQALQGYVAKTDLKAMSEYWNAEANYRLGNYKAAVAGFEKFAKSGVGGDEFQNLFYNIGYSYFKLKDYQAAANAFQPAHFPT